MVRLNILTDIGHRFLGLPNTDHFLIAAVLVFDLVAAPRLGMWAYSLFSLPGTVAHELCHWSSALVLGAKPKFPHIIPKREGDAWRLGSVQFVPNLLTVIPIALAPCLLLPLGIWYAVFVMHPATGSWYLIHVWVASTFLAASLPSRQDWKVAMPSITCALLLAYALHKLGMY